MSQMFQVDILQAVHSKKPGIGERHYIIDILKAKFATTFACMMLLSDTCIRQYPTSTSIGPIKMDFWRLGGKISSRLLY